MSPNDISPPSRVYTRSDFQCVHSCRPARIVRVSIKARACDGVETFTRVSIFRTRTERKKNKRKQLNTEKTELRENTRLYTLSSRSKNWNFGCCIVFKLSWDCRCRRRVRAIRRDNAGNGTKHFTDASGEVLSLRFFSFFSSQEWDSRISFFFSYIIMYNRAAWNVAGRREYSVEASSRYDEKIQKIFDTLVRGWGEIFCFPFLYFLLRDTKSTGFYFIYLFRRPFQWVNKFMMKK